MRLERLEINGFKSFSDRSELAFDKGVTAIVGPNGCGKSNVADAITWVMGEQSAKSLRGDKMEDVIFSGSDARKPTAAAEVRLRFSGVLKQVTAPAFTEQEANGHANGHANGLTNGHAPNGHAGDLLNGHANGNGHGNGAANGHGYHADGTTNGHALTRDEAEELIQSVAREVEVTRRLYRSGESEYLIDGQTCRLRDIHDLLMDTGLGAKAYAIIEQGKIGLILSSRPTDRRQLIEEAAGVTKYKSRRRAAELKLEAAQQNLTRIDDIVFEVEKQRGTLKRQAGRARRYQKLRDEMRRWEKVLFARRYRQLGEAIESTRDSLALAREQEALSAGHVSEVEAHLGRLRIELAESEAHATHAREDAHALELRINRRQQQLGFDREQVDALDVRSTAIDAERETLEARREPARAAIEGRRQAAEAAETDRDQAAGRAAADSEAYDAAHRELEGFEGDVEAARSQVFSAINAATALRHSLEHAASARERVLATLSTLQVEADDLRIERERIESDRSAAAEGLRRAHDALEVTRIARTARESELASARIEHEWRARTVRSREHDLAGLVARLASLEELQAGRVEYGDAARTVLAQANGMVGQQGAVADYLEVEPGHERAVEAYLGDLLQHVIVERAEQAEAGFRLVREQNAGRCGFLIAAADTAPRNGAPGTLAAREDGLTAMTSVVRATGPFAAAIEHAIGDAWIASSYEHAARASHSTMLPVLAADGTVFRGPHLVTGGAPQATRGILETKREIRELGARIDAERQAVAVLVSETAGLEAAMSQATNAIAALNAEFHRHEKTMVALEAQAARAADDTTRASNKGEQLARERRQAEEERDAIERREEEARASIARLEQEQRVADEQLTVTQKRLLDAREHVEELGRRAAEARAVYAALVERAVGMRAEVGRLEEAAVELEARAAALATELSQARQRMADLRGSIETGERQLADDTAALDGLRTTVMSAEDRVASLRSNADQLEADIKTARLALEACRATVADLDVRRATAEAELAHLAEACMNAVQSSLDEVLAEVAALEAQGDLTPNAAVIRADDPDDSDDEPVGAAGPEAPQVSEAELRTLSAEDAIGELRAKIDRLGPVNMMAIEQYDELETRYAFLTTQRKDLVESIAQTSEAIKRIDLTTRSRFIEAFTAINRNFQEMFSTLFGGGRAGLTLLDENDPLESGIEIIAQPPGKRLQSVQLLSGGEKALTAISLMFGLFKFKPSPFCLLDEIDAPLDDANIGRFVGMLRSMQTHTQFILITHNRKTMEIADRLYGVTMEEPGVSKLISVDLN